MFLKNKNFIFKIRRSKVTDYAALRKVGPMLSGETRTKRKKITFQTTFWARGDAETYLHGTTLSDFTIVCSKL